MNSTTIQDKIQRLQKQIDAEYPLVKEIVEALGRSGGRALLVGGAVRDIFLDKPLKDLDIEVHGLALNQVEAILKTFGYVRVVGKQFGVLRIDGLDVDWSLPRTDGAGRKPKVELDPHLSLEKAFRRRDLTVNAMGIDLITNQLEDPFNGQRDVQLKLFRVPDPDLFIEDPLRFFRVMQFIGRFGFKPDEELHKLCESMDISTVSKERIYQEFEKLFLRSNAPSVGIRWLQEVGRLKEILPELHATIGVPQRPDYHPEGDVFEHTMQALDAAVDISKRENLSKSERFILCCAALCHDLGKVTATKEVDGKIIAHGHEIDGVEPAGKIMNVIAHKNDDKEIVAKLVRYHMMPGQLVSQKSGNAAYKRLAKKLSPQTDMVMLARLAEADKRGRNPEKGSPLGSQNIVDVEQFLEKAKANNVLLHPEEPIVMGKDLIDKVGPGPQLGKLLQQAYEIQINEGIVDKQKLIDRVL